MARPPRKTHHATGRATPPLTIDQQADGAPRTAAAPPPASQMMALAPAPPAKHEPYEWMHVFDHIKDPVFIHDREFRILRCNRAYADCAGLPMENIIGAPYWQIFPKTASPQNGCVEALSSGMTELRSEFTAGFGEVFLTHDITAHRESGEFWYSRHLMENITARKIEEEIEKLKSSFSEAIIGSAPGIFFVVDQDNKLVRWNEELALLSGHAGESLEQAALPALLPESNQMPVLDKLATAFATGEADGEMELHCNASKPKFWVFSARRFTVADIPYVACFCIDQTEVKELECKLIKEKLISDTIIESAPGAFFMIDAQGSLVRWNDNLRKETGLSDEQIRGSSILSTIHPADRPLAAAKFLAAFATGYAQMEVRVLTPDLGFRIFLKTARRFMVDEVPYVAGFCFDVTDRKRTEDALGKEKAFSDALIESVPGTFYVVDMEGSYFRWNSYLNRITGLSNRDLEHRPSLLTIEERDRPLAAETMKLAFENGCAHADLHIVTRDRGSRLFSMTARRFQVDETSYLVGVGIDTTDWLSKLTELEHEAQTDPLTQIANRAYFLAVAKQEFARCRRYSHPLSLWMLDVDHFKHVNDTYGHHAGDLALQSLVTTSRQALRDWDILGRMGGEEFAVLLPETESSQALLVAERLRQAVANAMVPLANGKSVHLTVSIGIATVQEDDADIDALLDRADQALYEAKRTGRDKVILAERLPTGGNGENP